MELSKVSKKYLTNIPVKVRRALEIEEGDFLAWDIDEKARKVIVRVIKNPYKILKGKYRDPNLVYEMVEERADDLLLGEVKNASN